MKKTKINNPILITGGEGFIGRSIVKSFLELKIPVIVIDNNITSYPLETNDPLYQKIDEDISNINISSIPKVSGIIHLASVASPLVYKENPELVINPNTIGTIKLIEIAKRDKIRILFASTSEVYGHLTEELQKNKGIKETDSAYISLLTERSSYAMAKRFGEELIFNYKKSGGNASCFRLFNVYGKNMDLKNTGYGRVIPNFFYKIESDFPIDIFGDGEQIRCFLWIDDAIDAILGLFFYEGELPAAINIGKDEPVTINQLAKTISKLINKTYNIRYSERDKDDPLWRRPNISLIKSLINWKPKINLKQGLGLLLK